MSHGTPQKNLNLVLFEVVMVTKILENSSKKCGQSQDQNQNEHHHFKADQVKSNTQRRPFKGSNVVTMNCHNSIVLLLNTSMV